MDIGHQYGVIPPVAGTETISVAGMVTDSRGAAEAGPLRGRIVTRIADKADGLPLVIGDIALAVLLDVIEQVVGQLHRLGHRQVIANAGYSGGEGDGGGQLGMRNGRSSRRAAE